MKSTSPKKNKAAGKADKTLKQQQVEAGVPKIKKVPTSPSKYNVVFYEDIVETIHEPLLVLDMDLRVLFANQRFYTVFKTTKKKTIGHLVFDLGNEQWDIPLLRTFLEEIIPEKTKFNGFQIEHDFPAIGKRIMLLNARQITNVPQEQQMILLAIEDITDRMLTEQALQASEERFRNAFETANDGMLLIEKIKGQILDSNQASQELLGYSIKELQEKRIWEIGFIEDVKQFRQVYNLLEEAGFIVFDDTQVITKHGRAIDAYVILTDRAKVIQCNIRDITELKRAEAQLQEYAQNLEKKVEDRTRDMQAANEKLLQHERLATMGQVAGSVGHELRNPLNVISSSVYLLKKKLVGLDVKSQEYLDVIDQEVNRSAKIISELLDFGKIHPANTDLVKVSSLVSEALARNNPPENIEVTSQEVSGSVQILVDPQQIGQVLDNLIINAYQAMPAGGKLSVKTTQKKDGINISVADTGTGISEDNLRRLFEPLFTTKMRGIGLGLALSKNYVEANGGSISVKSKENQGSTFTISFEIGT